MITQQDIIDFFTKPIDPEVYQVAGSDFEEIEKPNMDDSDRIYWDEHRHDLVSVIDLDLIQALRALVSQYGHYILFTELALRSPWCEEENIKTMILEAATSKHCSSEAFKAVLALIPQSVLAAIGQDSAKMISDLQSPPGFGGFFEIPEEKIYLLECTLGAATLNATFVASL